VLGDPDILVVNPPDAIPGTGPDGHFRGLDNTDDADFDLMHKYFIMSTVYLVREAVPAMKRKGWGRLLNIGSIAMKNPHLDDPMPAVNLRVGLTA
jgi:3-oxoacyl-[acyl-carrier protein] reductase